MVSIQSSITSKLQLWELEMKVERHNQSRWVRAACVLLVRLSCVFWCVLVLVCVLLQLYVSSMFYSCTCSCCFCWQVLFSAAIIVAVAVGVAVVCWLLVVTTPSVLLSHSDDYLVGYCCTASILWPDWIVRNHRLTNKHVVPSSICPTNSSIL